MHTSDTELHRAAEHTVLQIQNYIKPQIHTSDTELCVEPQEHTLDTELQRIRNILQVQTI
jgi:hypothetical protein